MYFKKIEIPENFKYEETKCEFSLCNLGKDVYHLEAKSPRWKSHHSHALLTPETFAGVPSEYQVSWDSKCGLTIAKGTQKILTSKEKRPFGVCGKKWILPFEKPNDFLFYGQGEKNNGFEKSKTTTKFWNTDVWADFAMDDIINGVTDPMYVAIPYVLMKKGNHWIGILINNPFASFMAFGAEVHIANQQKANNEPDFYIGSNNGAPSIYIICGKSAAEVTRTYQTLVGKTDRPPLWALGHHQCRWGYESYDDLDTIDKEFTKHKIPNDGLWLDIDYMESFKVFTFNKKNFKNPLKQITELASRNKHVIPIIDPGVKDEKGYTVCDSGLENSVFCKTDEGLPYIGYVWPGKTLFPDFSLKKAKKWWAEEVKKFVETGISGAWLDMNDPSTGRVELDQMKFNDGKEDHESFHNQYALGMAEASKEGFLKANPGKRPFLLSRSGFISSNRHTAIWTGDNYSNFHHMRKSIPVTLNLSLSGIPFNGPDVPGFGGNPTDELAIKWYKSGFLFPFFRNHSLKDVRKQEPWTFSPEANKTIAHYIRLRYKLLPYMYNLFINQERNGDPILRPLFYEFESKKGLELEKIDSQFMVGSEIMQAPVLEEGRESRELVLPSGRWYSALSGSFMDGDKRVTLETSAMTTPIFVKEGAIVPMQLGTRYDNNNDLENIELHFFLDATQAAKNGKAKKVKTTYTFDDGKSFEYRKGAEAIFEISLELKDKVANVKIANSSNNSEMKKRSLDAKLFFHGDVETVHLNGEKVKFEKDVNPFK